MSLSCDCDVDWYPEPGQWYHMGHSLKVMPPVSRRKRCRCCGEMIQWGEEVFEFHRYMVPNDDVTERIHGEEGYPVAPWYTCEECSDLISAVEDLGFCWTFGEPIKDQIAEYRAAEKERNADPKGEFYPVSDYM